MFLSGILVKYRTQSGLGQVFFCSSVPVLFDTPGSPGVGRNTLFLLSPHLCFITVFICDLFVSRDDPLMS